LKLLADAEELIATAQGLARCSSARSHQPRATSFTGSGSSMLPAWRPPAPGVDEVLGGSALRGLCCAHGRWPGSPVVFGPLNQATGRARDGRGGDGGLRQPD